MAIDHATRLEVDDDLAGLAAVRLADHQVDTRPQNDRPVDRMVGGRLRHRVPATIERREALDELGDEVDGLAAQVGGLALRQAGDVVADAALLVGQPGQRLVDDVGGGRLATPVEQQLDRLVGDGALGPGR